MAAVADVASPGLDLSPSAVVASKFRIERVLGKGGMGIVVSAMHLELDQRVALKFLLPSADVDDEARGRFIHEAKAAVRLRGAHIAKVLDVGRLEDGCPFLVMEYLEGHDLKHELRRRPEPIPIADAVGWVLQACEGV